MTSDPRKWRPTFHISTLLLLTAIVGLSIAWWRDSRALVRAREEARVIKEGLQRQQQLRNLSESGLEDVTRFVDNLFDSADGDVALVN